MVTRLLVAWWRWNNRAKLSLSYPRAKWWGRALGGAR